MPEASLVDNNVFRHFKGGRYRLLLVARDSETCEPVIVYISLQDGTAWTRTEAAWSQMVETPQPDGTILLSKRFVREPIATLEASGSPTPTP